MNNSRVLALLLCAACGKTEPWSEVLDGSYDVLPQRSTASSVDLACAHADREDCYNQVDDDCNGRVDCDDPACSPTSECVPVARGFALGAEVGPDEDCPTGFSGASTRLGAGLSAGELCDGCTCTPETECAGNLFERASCGGSVIAQLQVGGTKCLGVTPQSQNVGLELFPVPRCGPSGMPVVPPVHWEAETRFCAVARTGGGCAAGNRCVPRATRHCALADGAERCPTAYAPEAAAGPWYAAVDDQRVCGAVCTCDPPLGASCGQTHVLVYSDASCQVQSGDLQNGAAACGLAPVRAMKAIRQGVVLPQCSPSTAVRGVATPAGETTLCCL